MHDIQLLTQIRGWSRLTKDALAKEFRLTSDADPAATQNIMKDLRKMAGPSMRVFVGRTFIRIECVESGEAFKCDIPEPLRQLFEASDNAAAKLMHASGPRYSKVS